MFLFSYLQIVSFLNHAANKQVYFGTCITSQASGGMLRRLAVIDRVKHLSDTALRA
ncbi:hypothetical protein ED375_06665 [Muribaculaceae bacterium Isolate-004 (NCI)]|uniref:Uncharacterized protein n=1 Tax=Bacteroides acidifaciens TaxID=85831 RepID=A0A8H0D2S5_9BACE|nr:hypothetical protein [Parabacteroides goldsteinii]RXE62127.1 hypothetical protein ED375_06665 [Muribaculaceae bacterium Isolate-004 (NCI)]RXE65104.1 hypothetical protein ED388_08585 [Muribaculaceae bacterium Isolate-007 (NCI)]RXE65680.1 hypothetical protein ED328_14245 [Muribaculaceae bacterium Isolate-001 (NCI)]RXE74319.1 hypothetical protein ED551_04020 [Muribaculaceae bacterium Isolate-013 (NCI)]TFU49731.1 hypothetical protein E4T97_09100 [Bacteroides acidifaciens]TFU68595.1 hypothetica